MSEQRRYYAIRDLSEEESGTRLRLGWSILDDDGDKENVIELSYERTRPHDVKRDDVRRVERIQCMPMDMDDLEWLHRAIGELIEEAQK
jgi:hypothetical protein